MKTLVPVSLVLIAATAQAALTVAPYVNINNTNAGSPLRGTLDYVDSNWVLSPNNPTGTIATTDWWVFGDPTAGTAVPTGPYSTKSGGDVIQSVTRLAASGPDFLETGTKLDLGWTGGDPVASLSGSTDNDWGWKTGDSQSISNLNEGFQITIGGLATGAYQARVYFSGYLVDATLTASLAGYTNQTAVATFSNGGYGQSGYFAVSFQANNPGDVLTLTLVETTDRGNYDNISLAAVVTNAVAVPEPATYALLGGVAALGLVMWRRRRMA